MNDITNWVLTSILGPLMLPLFALATLCVIAGAKPEPIVTSFLSLIMAVINGFFRLVGMLVSAAFGIPSRRSYPPTRRYPPKDPKDPKVPNDPKGLTASKEVSEP